MNGFKNHPLTSGTRLTGRYTIVKRLAEGGFGVVYLARTEQGGAVALKEFLPSLIPCRVKAGAVAIQCKNSIDEARFKMGVKAFFHEADLVARLKDSRIVEILDVFEANGTVYYAMPLEQGETLQRRVRREGVLSDALTRRIFIEVAMGVLVLHTHGLLHLDIKPGNLWLRPDGSVLILDLGASRVQKGSGFLAPPTHTPGFSAPEQHGHLQDSVLSEQTDIYGVAASLYACLMGEPPQAAPLRTEMHSPLAHERGGQHAIGLLHLIDWGMHLDPDLRPRTIQEFLDDLIKVTRVSTSTYKKSFRFIRGAESPFLF